MSKKRYLVPGTPGDNLIVLPEGTAGAMAADLENPISRKLLTALALCLVIAFTALGEVTASATIPSPESLANGLLTASYLSKAGFTDETEKPSSSSSTGVASCPNGAQEAFKDSATDSGFVAELLACNTPQDAAAVLSRVATEGEASLAPPKLLGSSAVERRVPGPGYTIDWRSGNIFAFVGLETDISTGGSSSTTTTTAPAPPITADEQKTLAAAALSLYEQSDGVGTQSTAPGAAASTWSESEELALLKMDIPYIHWAPVSTATGAGGSTSTYPIWHVLTRPKSVTVELVDIQMTSKADIDYAVNVELKFFVNDLVSAAASNWVKGRITAGVHRATQSFGYWRVSMQVNSSDSGYLGISFKYETTSPRSASGPQGSHVNAEQAYQAGLSRGENLKFPSSFSDEAADRAAAADCTTSRYASANLNAQYNQGCVSGFEDRSSGQSGGVGSGSENNDSGAPNGSSNVGPSGENNNSGAPSNSGAMPDNS